MSTKLWRAGLVVAALVLLGRGLARADAATEARLREALRATTAQLRSLEDERGTRQAAEAALAAARKENAALRAQLAAARRPVARTNDRELADLTRRLAEQAEGASRLSLALDRCRAGAREANESARAAEVERARLSGEVAALQKRSATLQDRNARLFAVGKEILAWMVDVGIPETNPTVLGLERVKLENAAQDYEDALIEARGKPEVTAGGVR